MSRWGILLTVWGILLAVVLVVRWRLFRTPAHSRHRPPRGSRLTLSVGPIFVTRRLRTDPAEETQRLAEASREAQRLEPLDPRD